MQFKLYRKGNYVGTFDGVSANAVIAGMVKRMRRLSKAEAAQDESKMMAEYSAIQV